MEKRYMTALKCGNADVVKACVWAIKDIDRDGCKGWKEGDTELYAETENDAPDEKIQEISKQYADATIKCWYGYEGDNILEIHVVDYYAGQKKELRIVPSYKSIDIPFDDIPLHDKKDQVAIYEKAVAFCRRLDTIKKEYGELFIEWFREEVRYVFEHDGMDGIRYRIEATKKGSQIYFKVFKGLVKYNWRKIIPLERGCPF
jgi:hypothetical protein